MPGLYIHIPLCVKKCAYCDFVSFQDNGGLAAYCDALQTEIRLLSETLPTRTYNTVFFGGGTPSLLSGWQLTAIMETLRSRFIIAGDAEISMECNPGTVTAEKLTAYRTAGVNRLSVGLQSADDSLLRTIGRIHDYAAFCDAVRLLKAAGFQNFNVDVMHGLPGQSGEQYLDTIRRAADTGATHISAYALILEAGTPLYRDVRKGRIQLPEDDATADMEDAGMSLLASLGYQRYEISNFAQDGFSCRHNLNYWDNGEYAGLGLAAHSAMRVNGVWTRWANTEELSTYLRRLSQGVRPTAETLELKPIEEMFETVMLGLRKVDGVSYAAFFDRFGVALVDVYAEAVDALKSRGWLVASPHRLALNERGLDLQNAALQFFMD